VLPEFDDVYSQIMVDCCVPAVSLILGLKECPESHCHTLLFCNGEALVACAGFAAAARQLQQELAKQQRAQAQGTLSKLQLRCNVISQRAEACLPDFLTPLL
jgi:hypothetical protein